MPLIFLVVILVIVVGVFLFSINFREQPSLKDFSLYKRKPFLFDSVTELDLFRILTELYSDKYHIFAQVNYSHLIQPRRSTFYEERRLRSSIDRKSADFVLCDKEHVIPKLVIELDGYVHNFKNKQIRDKFINEITKIVDLPILHLKTNNLNKEFVKSEVDKKLFKSL